MGHPQTGNKYGTLNSSCLRHLQSPRVFFAHFMNLLIIVNKAAAKAQRAWPTVEAALKSADIKYDVYLTTEPGDATVRTRDALRQGTTTVAVVGGDGTLSESAEG